MFSSQALYLKYPRSVLVSDYWTKDGKLVYRLELGPRMKYPEGARVHSFIITRAELEEIRKQISDKLEMEVPDHAVI